MLSVFTYHKDNHTATIVMQNGEYIAIQVREDGSSHEDFYSYNAYAIKHKEMVRDITTYWSLLNIIDFDISIPVNLINIRY